MVDIFPPWKSPTGLPKGLWQPVNYWVVLDSHDGCLNWDKCLRLFLKEAMTCCAYISLLGVKIQMYIFLIIDWASLQQTAKKEMLECMQLKIPWKKKTPKNSNNDRVTNVSVMSSCTAYLIKVREHSLPYDFTHSWKEKRYFHAFPKGVSAKWMLIASTRIWTWPADSVFRFNKHNISCLSFNWHTYQTVLLVYRPMKV